MVLKGPENFWDLPWLEHIWLQCQPGPSLFVCFLGATEKWGKHKASSVPSDLGAILARVCSLGHGKHLSLIELYPRGLCWSRHGLRDGWHRSELLLRFKAFQSLTNTMLCGWSVFLGGHLAARMSNHICFGVTFMSTLRPNGIVFLLSQFPLCYGPFS